MWTIFNRKNKATQVVRELLDDYSLSFRDSGTGIWYTTDAPEIEAKVGHLVLIYDRNMPIVDVNDEFKKSIEGFYEGRAFTKQNVEAFISTRTNQVIAFQATNGSIPVWSGQVGAPGAPIRGGLMLVSPKAIFALDRLYGNNVYCRRVLMDCERYTFKSYYSHTHERNHQTDQSVRSCKAWVYLGIPDKWDIDAGYNWQPLRIRQTKSKKKISSFYHYPNRRQSFPAVA